MAIKKIEIQDSSGNSYYPHTDASVVKYDDITIYNALKRQDAYKTSGTNGYTVSIPGITKYYLGLEIKIIIGTTNTGASTLNVNNLGAKTILDGFGNALLSGALKANIPYILCYNGTNFILLGKGGEINRGTPTVALNCGGIYNIQPGYYSGGKVAANSLASHLSSDTLELASQLLAGVKAHTKNGVQITGTATIASLGGMLVQEGNTTANYINGKWILDLSTVLKFTPKILFGYLDGLSNYGEGTFIFCNGYVDNLSFRTTNKSSTIEITAPRGEYLNQGADRLADLSNIEISCGGGGTTRTCKWVAIG